MHTNLNFSSYTPSYLNGSQLQAGSHVAGFALHCVWHNMPCLPAYGGGPSQPPAGHFTLHTAPCWLRQIFRLDWFCLWGFSPLTNWQTKCEIFGEAGFGYFSLFILIFLENLSWCNSSSCSVSWFAMNTALAPCLLVQTVCISSYPEVGGDIAEKGRLVEPPVFFS